MSKLRPRREALAAGGDGVEWLLRKICAAGRGCNANALMAGWCDESDCDGETIDSTAAKTRDWRDIAISSREDRRPRKGAGPRRTWQKLWSWALYRPHSHQPSKTSHAAHFRRREARLRPNNAHSYGGSQAPHLMLTAVDEATFDNLTFDGSSSSRPTSRPLGSSTSIQTSTTSQSARTR